MEEPKKKASIGFSVLAFVLVVASIAVSIRLSFGTQMAVFVGSVVAVVAALIAKTSWKEIQDASMKYVSDCGPVFFILLLVGILVGTWMVGGNLPSFIYYGLKLISPKAILPLTFVLCALTSVFTGTSYGSIATMGLAMFGVGVNLGIPAPLIAGAVVSGSYFGDKMSPMSDTTNLSPAMAGTDLYKHIYSMLFTTVPATIVVLIIYLVMGLKYSATAMDTSNIQLMMDTLSANHNINIIAIVPLLLVLVLACCRVPSIMALSITVIVSVIWAVVNSGADITTVITTAYNGFVSETGVPMVDTILTRGGCKSMIGTISVMFFSSFMAGAFNAAGVLAAITELLMRFVRGAKSLIVSTLCLSYLMVLVTGNQTMGIVIPGTTMAESYDRFNLDRKVLSRCLEDAGTLGSVLIPWGAGCAYVSGVLGVGASYIPYAFLCWVVPVFSLFCAFTGFGVWNSKGEPKWKKKSNLEYDTITS